MQTQQAVLDFFAQAENLSLGLAVAELMDETRARLNRQFWEDLQAQFNVLSEAQNWQIRLTEDRNRPDAWVGLHAVPHSTAAQLLYPLLEQQNLASGLRIYLGLVWRAPPTPEHLALAANLTAALAAQGFKQNERFLGWQWTPFHPQRRDFLLRYQQQPAALFDAIRHLWMQLCTHPALAPTNAALAALSPSSPMEFRARA